MNKETKLIKMPSIGQFNNTIRDIKHQTYYQGQDENDEPIYDKNVKLPKVLFRGTTKIHGTNASVVYNGKTIWAQSKGNVITPEKDNYGFASFVENNKTELLTYMQQLSNMLNAKEVIIYGEFAGKGIQKNVAISELPKTWYMFGIKYITKNEDEYRWVRDPEHYLLSNSKKKIKSIFDFKTWEILIDFEDPKKAQTEIIKLVDQVDKECPVGKALGVDGHGEGIVWIGYLNDERHIFKTKGESHSATKVKTLKHIDNVKEEAKRELAEKVTPAWRLEQAYEQSMELGSGGIPDKNKTGVFLKWVNQDIIKEELDTIMDAGFEPKEIFRYVSQIAKTWLFEQLDKEDGL